MNEEFWTVEAKQLANVIIKGIVADISDRRGLRQMWEASGPEIRSDIKAAWRKIIVAAIKGQEVES